MALITPPIRPGESGSERHHYWGRVPAASDLPNVAGSPTQSPPVGGVNVLEPGDVCWVDATQCLYVNLDPTTGAAIWRCMVQSGGNQPGHGSILFWGNDDPVATVGRRFLHPGYDDQVAETTPVLIPAPAAGVIRDLTVYFNSPYTPPPAPNGTLDFTLVVNGVDTALALTGILATQATPVQNTTTAIPVAATDLLAVAVDKIGVGAISIPRRIVVTFRWT